MRREKRRSSDPSIVRAKIDKGHVDDITYDEVTDVFDLLTERVKSTGERTREVVQDATRLVKTLAST